MKLTKEWVEAELKRAEQQEPHRPPEEEYAFYMAVRDGNMEYVQKNCAAEVFSNPVGMGVLSKNPLQNIKYHFVITASLVTRYCVTGGMEAEQAYRLSDFYILRADACTDVASVVALHHAMVLDYTGKMALRKKADIVSQPVSRCVDYIYDHINERITVQTLSEYTGLSVSYLSRVFKQKFWHLHQRLHPGEKIEKAQNLLRYSDASLIDIANYLAFSSRAISFRCLKALWECPPKNTGTNISILCGEKYFFKKKPRYFPAFAVGKYQGYELYFSENV